VLLNLGSGSFMLSPGERFFSSARRGSSFRLKMAIIPDHRIMVKKKNVLSFLFIRIPFILNCDKHYIQNFYLYQEYMVKIEKIKNFIDVLSGRGFICWQII
jgi:hypothetical protein